MNYKGIIEGNKIARKLIKIRRNKWKTGCLMEDSVMETWYFKHSRKFRKTKVPCSCFMCQWEKKMGIPHKQEVMAREREREQLKEALNV